MNRKILSGFFSNFTGIVGIFLLSAILLLAVFAPVFTQHDPVVSNLKVKLQPPLADPNYVFGTDQLGRDIFSRLVFGARVSMFVGIASTLISCVLGVALGLMSGFFGGWFDNIVTYLCDVMLSIPFIVLVIAVIAILGSGTVNVIITLGLSGWVQFAKIARSKALTMRNLEYVVSAISTGASSKRVLFRHILPNTVPSIITMASFQFAQMIIAEASLSFLGMGIRPPAPSWGGMISDGRSFMQTSWWLSAIPGIAILLVVVSANLIGDWLREQNDKNITSF